MSNINSFAENMNRVVELANNQLSILNGVQESVSTDSDAVSIPITDVEDGTESHVSIPSWNALTKKVEAVQNSIASLMRGHGIVSVGDGTAREVKMTSIASTPPKIENLANPTTFNIDANWWFENFMFPCAQVTIDMLGKIDDKSDRVLVNRVILDNSDEMVRLFYINNILGSGMSYENLLALLNTQSIPYTEDNEILDLPLARTTYYGRFEILDSIFINNKEWFQVDTLEYKMSDISNENFINSTIKLQVGDFLSADNCLYKILGIDEANMRIRLTCTIGYQFPSTGETLEFYNNPWQSKKVDVKFGNNEINIVYFKGINDDFNIIANEWSDPIMFVSNDLVLEGSSDTTFDDYYRQRIVDWGAQLIGEARERKISAWQGSKPNAPVINANDFAVVQINTQVNASLDTEQVISMKADIESTKSRLVSLKGTIDAQQTTLQTITEKERYNKLKDQITENTDEYKQLEIKYRTSLNTIQSLLRENNAVNVNPKYHIRGFFGIPEPVDNQEVIGFEILYRYIKEDTTGTELKTFTYRDMAGAEHTGVYTDWNLMRTDTLEKSYIAEKGRFEWQSKSISLGDQININQVDIPITKGEKVEFKIRSISEAGYPYCPLKSDWSNAVIIDFPSNLMTSSDVDNIITDINDENILLQIENELRARGLLDHLSDSKANINSVNGTYFKHKAENISYEFHDPDTGEIRTISVQEALDSLFAFVHNFLKYTDNVDLNTYIINQIEGDGSDDGSEDNPDPVTHPFSVSASIRPNSVEEGEEATYTISWSYDAYTSVNDITKISIRGGQVNMEVQDTTARSATFTATLSNTTSFTVYAEKGTESDSSTVTVTVIKHDDPQPPTPTDDAARYYGLSTKESLTSSDVTSLGNVSKGTSTVEWTANFGSTEQYFYFAFPASQGSYIVKQVGLGTLDSCVESSVDVSGVTYKVYRSPWPYMNTSSDLQFIKS